MSIFADCSMFGVIILLKDEILTNQPQTRRDGITLNYGLVSLCIEYPVYYVEVTNTLARNSPPNVQGTTSVLSTCTVQLWCAFANLSLFILFWRLSSGFQAATRPLRPVLRMQPAFNQTITDLISSGILKTWLFLQDLTTWFSSITKAC